MAGCMRNNSVLCLSKYIILLCLVCCLRLVNAEEKQVDPSWGHILMRDLFSHYDKDNRPAPYTNPTKVNLHLRITHIDLDEHQFMMTVYAVVILNWHDEKLKWNKSSYGGIEALHVPAEEIWRPDILLDDSALGRPGHWSYIHTKCFLQPDGNVLWDPPAHSSVYCDFDLSKWPFDVQTCTLNFSPWLHKHVVQLSTNLSMPVEILMDSEWSSGWRLLSVTKEVIENHEIKIHVSVQRLIAPYQSVIIIPSIALVLMAIAVFLLPPEDSRKLFLSSLTILAIYLLLNYCNQRLPNMSYNPPIIALFHATTLVLVVISLITSVIVNSMASINHENEVPCFIISMLNGSFLSTILFLPSIKKAQPKTEGQEELGNLKENKTDEIKPEVEGTVIEPTVSAGWILLATAIDRLLFFSYLIAFIVLIVRCSMK